MKSTVAGGKPSSVQMATPTSQHASAQSPSLNESAANDSITVPDDQMPERASFMGIPPEMRLRIYEFLLDGSRVNEMPLDNGEKHCCIVNPYRKTKQEPLKCTCAKSTFPQILAVNKLVFAEAAPLLYSTTELRIALPIIGQSFDIDATLQELSGRAKASITNAVLPTSLCKLDIILYDSEERTGNMSSLWAKLAAEFPRLKNIRLQIRFDEDLEEWNHEFVDWQQFSGVFRLPGIECLDVEIMHYKIDEIPVELGKAFATGLDTYLRNELSRSGKSIKILSFGKEEKIAPCKF